MLKLLILSSVLMVAAAYPSFQLLSLPSEETISLTSLLQPEQPPNSIASSSSEESVDAPASSPETPTPTQASSAPTEAAATAEPTDSSLQAADLTSTSLTPSSLGSLSIQQQLPIQHQLLPPETISLPISITTSPGLRTILAPETIRIHEPTVAKVGELVQKIPTAVSHQSQTVVHKHAEVVTPIVAPAIRTITSQVVRAYHTPLVYAAHAPVIKFIQH